ncbi:SCAN domain-containing protein 3 [Frankliniella fusca]|uniref:SCAN domain-containing protein 3 n=1 Tax=Frankliniella fusca TaxID=407009 RepID=A0AAE1GPR9_9NEOP|nr:SCAN domain-containing protein 3 [Frankliniella fusca]
MSLSKSAKVGNSDSRHYKPEWEKLPQFRGAANAEAEAAKTTDLKLAAFIACHCSTKTVDHLGEILKDVGQEGRLKYLRLHRTKCSQLIMKVIAPEIQRDIVRDLGDEYFSVIVDESTDTATKKFMAVIIKYFSFSRKQMVLEFLGLIEFTDTTAPVLYAGFKEFCTLVGLNVKRLYAIGTDGASNLSGMHSSLYALLKTNDAPWLVLMRCICHSLDKCASKASAELPSNLEFMIRETNSWFAHSSLRKEKHAQIYKALNDGMEPPSLVKLCTTRWLSWGNAVARILDLYDSLKELFNGEVQAANDSNRKADKEKCYTAAILANMYNDETNRLYLTFLRPVLKEVNRTNMLFQSSSAGITVVYRELRMFVFSTVRRFFKPQAVPVASGEDGILRTVELTALRGVLNDNNSLLPLDRIDFGESFKCIVSSSSRRLPTELLETVQRRCANFLLHLSKEAVERLPMCIESVERLRFFAPKRVLAQSGRPKFNQLPLDFIPHSFSKDTLARQWARLYEFKLREVSPDLDDEKSIDDVDIFTFWFNVWQIRDGRNQRPFRELCVYVLTLLSLPLSNAVVERLFSIMTAVKTKQRSRLSLKMLQSILIVRGHLKASVKCCRNFTPTPAMLELFRSDVLYPKKAVPADGENLREDQDPDDPDPEQEEEAQIENDAAMDLLNQFENFLAEEMAIDL